MADAEREFSELRREVVEARNQAIKTDNQVKNLSIDVKAFEKRFDFLERRTRIASIGAHVIVAATIILAAYVVHGSRVRALNEELSRSVASAADAKKAAEQALATARSHESAVEQERGRRERSAANAIKLIDLLDKGREKEAVDLLETVDLASLTSLEAKLLDRRVADLRARAAESAYKAARAAQSANQHAGAIADYRRALAVEPDGHLASASRYYLATELWNLKRHEEAEPVLREILKKEQDKTAVEEVRYLLGVSLVALGKRDDARTVLNEVIRKGGKFVTSAKGQLALLDAAPTVNGNAAGNSAPGTTNTPPSSTSADTTPAKVTPAGAAAPPANATH
jgi:TolA-binding protein